MSSSSTATLGVSSATSMEKVKAGASAMPRHYYQQATTSRGDNGGGQCAICYQTFGDKASLHKHWKSHALLSTAPRRNGEVYPESIAGSSGVERRDDDGGESRLIIDLDSTAAAGSESSLTSAPASALSPVLALRQQQNSHRRMTITTAVNTATTSSQFAHQQATDFVQRGTNLIGLAQQIQLQQQQNMVINAANANARVPTPRMQQPAGIPVPMMTPQTPAVNPYLLSAALSPYAATQQLLLARAAAAGASGVPNQAAQLLMPNAQPASPYSYMMPTAFSPFCMPLNDATFAAAIAAAASSGQNPAAVAAAIANAGLLIPQTALASAAAAQLLCQQTGGAGIGLQGLPSSAGTSEDLTTQKSNQINGYDAPRRMSAMDVKNVQRQQLVDDADLLVQQGNEILMNSPAISTPSAVSALSREAVSEHIKRLISENEAIVEPPPALLKRRSYTTKGHQGSASLDYSSTGIMAANGSGVKPPFGRSNRSQSLIDPPAVAAAAHNHTRQQATPLQNNILRSDELNSAFSPMAVDPSVYKSKTCQYCAVPFRNAASLRDHEFRCANRVESGAGESNNPTPVGVPTVFSPTAVISPPAGNPSIKAEANPVLMSPGSSAVLPITKTLPQGSGPVVNPVTTASRESGGENKHPLKKRILADAQKFGSLPSTGIERVPNVDWTNRSTAPLAVVTRTNADELFSSATTSKQEIGEQLLAARVPLVQTTIHDVKLVPVPSQLDPRLARTSQLAQQPSVFTPAVPNVINGSTSVAIPPNGFQILPALPKTNLSPVEQSTRFFPYRLTFKVHSDVGSTSESAVSGTLSPGRLDKTKTQQVTQPTFCCHRKSPIAFSAVVPHESKESAYAVWPQVCISPEDAKLNILMMGGCNVRARWTSIKYSTATTTMSLLVATDSAYWEHSRKLQRFAAAAAAAAVASANVGGLSVQENVSKEEEEETAASAMETEETEQATKVEADHPQQASVEDAQVSTENSAKQPSKTITFTSRQRLKDILTGGGLGLGSNALAKKVAICSGGYKTNEAYTYVRGRGRGRYVCERCGIRCKKPSMLKKHIRTHLNLRPYTCPQCVFSFKTKGNLTKHMKSQAHSKKIASLTTNGDGNSSFGKNLDLNSDQGSRFDNDSEDDTEEQDGYSTEEDIDGDDDRCIFENGDRSTAELRRRRYSYKNIWTNVKDGCYPQRTIRTPPPSPTSTNQPCINYSQLFDRCDTAPPALNAELATNSRHFDGQDINQDCGSVKSASNDGERSLEEKSNQPEADGENRPDAGPVAASTSSDTENQPAMAESGSSSLEPYFLNEGKCQCEICGKNFPKVGLLRLHMNVHYIEKTARRYDYKCSFCNSSFRSRSLLQKHTSTAHQKQVKQQQLRSTSAEKTAIDGGPTSTEVEGKSEPRLGTYDQGDQGPLVETLALATGLLDKSQGTTNPRPFVCADCGVAFRIHGHLSKHLRSKLHITKMENMGKLPIGLFAKLEDAGSQFLAEIDTSDCANSLASLLKLAERFNMLVDESTSSTTKSEPKPILAATTVSLTCTEEMLPTSPPPPAPTAIVPSELTGSVAKSAKMPVESKPLNGLSETVVLAADVWVPPVVERLQATTTNAARSKNSSNHTSSCNQQWCGAISTGSQDGSDVEKSAKPALTSPVALTHNCICRFCNLSCPSPLELEIHLHVDHVVMKDGDDFRCPRANCDSVYPNQESLRQHLVLHFYGKLDDKIGGSATAATSESSNGCDVSRTTVAALSRKLIASNSNFVAVNGEADGHERSQKKVMKTRLVKLSSIPESSLNSHSEHPGTTSSVCSNSSSSRGGLGGCGTGSTDNSPSSAAGIDSDASRASINSSHSASPIGIADSPAAADGGVGGRCSSGRQSAKRKSLEDGGPFPKKAAPNVLDQHQLLQMHPMQQAAVLSSTPVNANVYFHRVPTVSSQSPVLFHQPGNGGVMTPNSVGGHGWSPSPLLQQQFIGARQQLSPPQPFCMNANGAASGFPMSFFGLQNHFASAVTQQNVAKLLAAGGINPFWNSPAAMSASQFLNNSSATPDAAAVLSAAAGLTGLNDATIGLLLQPQQCILCGKQCANSASLQEHLLSHSLPRPYVCEHCDAGFTTEQALQSHRPCRQQRIDV